MTLGQGERHSLSCVDTEICMNSLCTFAPISAWTKCLLSIWGAFGKYLLNHLHRKEMASLPCERDSLTLLLVTFKKICFPLLCDVLKRGLLRLRFESQAHWALLCCPVSAGRPRAGRPQPGGGPSRSPSPSRRCRSAGRSTPTTRRTRTSSASTPTTSSTSSRKVWTGQGCSWSSTATGG